eukprot:8128881-Ditylum_brightwellii.AAC.1
MFEVVGVLSKVAEVTVNGFSWLVVEFVVVSTALVGVVDVEAEASALTFAAGVSVCEEALGV